MPTSAAVATTGEIFVADGYCNNQILKFNAAGILLMAIPSHSDTLTLNLPHSVTLLEHLDMVCIADRENMRIVCPKAGLKTYADLLDPPTVIEDPTLGRVFAVASHGNTIYAVNGPTSQNIAVRGFTVNAVYGNILDTWEPSTVSISVLKYRRFGRPANYIFFLFAGIYQPSLSCRDQKRISPLRNRNRTK